MSRPFLFIHKLFWRFPNINFFLIGLHCYYHTLVIKRKRDRYDQRNWYGSSQPHAGCIEIPSGPYLARTRMDRIWPAGRRFPTTGLDRKDRKRSRLSEDQKMVFTCRKGKNFTISNLGSLARHSCCRRFPLKIIDKIWNLENCLVGDRQWCLVPQVARGPRFGPPCTNPRITNRFYVPRFPVMQIFRGIPVYCL